METILAPSESKSLAEVLEEGALQINRTSTAAYKNVFIFPLEDIGAPSTLRSFGGLWLLAVAPRPVSYAWVHGSLYRVHSQLRL
jgi:hypothetical protein